MSSAYFEPRIWVSKWPACRPAHAALSASRASLGASLSSAAAAVSPVDNAAKYRSATGGGPTGRGVQADTAAVVTSTAKAELVADTTVIFVAIEADVMKSGRMTGGGAPRPNRYLLLLRGLRRDLSHCGRDQRVVAGV